MLFEFTLWDGLTDNCEEQKLSLSHTYISDFNLYYSI